MNDAAHRELVRETSVSYRPLVICLQEKKISSMSNSIILETLGGRMASYCTLDALGTWGGILLAWNQEAVQMSEVVVKQFTVLATVRVLSGGTSFRLSTCYGPADDGRKE